MKLKGVKEIYAIFVSLFMDKMEKEEPIQIDIEKVIKKKAPEVGKKNSRICISFFRKNDLSGADELYSAGICRLQRR